MPGKVRCFDCGLLAIRTDDGTPAEAMERTRELGCKPGVSDSRADLFCYAGKRDLSIKEYAGRDELAHAISETIDCDRFRPHLEGRSPERHEEMAIMEEVESKIAAEKSERLKWQEQVEATAEKRERNTQSLAERRHQDNRRDFRWYLAITAAGVALSAVALWNSCQRVPGDAAPTPAASSSTSGSPRR